MADADVGELRDRSSELKKSRVFHTPSRRYRDGRVRRPPGAISGSGRDRRPVARGGCCLAAGHRRCRLGPMFPDQAPLTQYVKYVIYTLSAASQDENVEQISPPARASGHH